MHFTNQNVMFLVHSRRCRRVLSVLQVRAPVRLVRRQHNLRLLEVLGNMLRGASRHQHNQDRLMLKSSENWSEE